MTSVVIAAHNEATVIGRCLDALLGDAGPGEFDVTVVANGCDDDTAAVARAHGGVRVLEITEASKPAALNAGDAVAIGFPRMYLDADMEVSAEVPRALRAALEETPGGCLAAFPARRLVLVGRPLPVRAYFAINNRLPVFQTGLFGRGVIALSASGRARFDRFPAMVADDLFLDSLFAPPEKRQVDQVFSSVAAPMRTRDLLRRLVRVRRGNAALRAAASAGELAPGVRPADRMSWLRDVVLPRPWLAPAAVVYAALTVTAELLARREPRPGAIWGRDDSTRRTGSGGSGR